MCYILGSGLEMNTAGEIYSTGPHFESRKQLCSVCFGRGTVLSSSYTQFASHYVDIHKSEVTCRTCFGRGIV